MLAGTPAPGGSEAPRPSGSGERTFFPGASPSSWREGVSPGVGPRAQSPGLSHVLTCLVVRPCPSLSTEPVFGG